MKKFCTPLQKLLFRQTFQHIVLELRLVKVLVQVSKIVISFSTLQKQGRQEITPLNSFGLITNRSPQKVKTSSGPASCRLTARSKIIKGSHSYTSPDLHSRSSQLQVSQICSSVQLKSIPYFLLSQEHIPRSTYPRKKQNLSSVTAPFQHRDLVRDE